MEIVIAPSSELAKRAAQEIVRLIGERPHAVLGLATGSSPLETYDAVTALYEKGAVSFAQASAFTLDEYVGLPPGHPESYREFIIENFVSRVDLPLENLHTPPGNLDDVEQGARDYDEAIRAAGGVDLQILGIGGNGHIGFNEPGSDLESRTHIEKLAERTRIDNARFFGGNIDDVPTHAITQGVGTILEARQLVLIASGTSKADAVAQLVDGGITSSCPASVIQSHSNALVLLDEAAASSLK